MLAIANAQNFRSFALSVHYGQRHHAELAAAKRIAAHLGAHEHRVMGVDLAGIGGSALTDSTRRGARGADRGNSGRRTSRRATPCCCRSRSAGRKSSAPLTSSLASTPVDYSGYPDCRPEFVAAFENLAQLATKAGVEGGRFKIHAPLIQHVQSGDHPQGRRSGSGLRHDRFVLPGGCAGPCLRPLRFVPPACGGVRRRRRARTRRATRERCARCYARLLRASATRVCYARLHSRCSRRRVRLSCAAHWDGSSVGRARPF